METANQTLNIKDAEFNKVQSIFETRFRVFTVKEISKLTNLTEQNARIILEKLLKRDKIRKIFKYNICFYFPISLVDVDIDLDSQIESIYQEKISQNNLLKAQDNKIEAKLKVDAIYFLEKLEEYFTTNSSSTKYLTPSQIKILFGKYDRSIEHLYISSYRLMEILLYISNNPKLFDKTFKIETADIQHGIKIIGIEYIKTN